MSVVSIGIPYAILGFVACGNPYSRTNAALAHWGRGGVRVIQQRRGGGVVAPVFYATRTVADQRADDAHPLRAASNSKDLISLTPVSIRKKRR